ncbi:MAG: YifB family Mg chelatase-like AAA ATPase [Actinobacteria bacterium]|nr:YifB family Mg chelatase-like AAA ATPase [Actinomycetota bacterium]
MLATVTAVALVGLDAHPVVVEATASQGLPGTRVVGLPDTAVREAADRVKSAARRSGLAWPDNRVTVNLAPAALRKSGAGFDLPMALAVLGATQQVPRDALRDCWAVGELGLDGTVRPVPGILPMAAAARAGGARLLLVASAAAVEASLVAGLEVVPVDTLAEAAAVLTGEEPARDVVASPPVVTNGAPDLADVRGQAVARRAVEVAAAGGHHLLLSGPPGCGKSMLAERMAGVLPPLSLDEALEVAAIHSVAGVRDPDEPLSLVPPFRSPHHTTSASGLVGGGSGVARPGELSLAHRGILFLDEMLEMPRWVLDALRQPLESGRVRIVRSQAAVAFPADVLLVAATNPCPCGNLGSTAQACRCSPDRVERYRSRLSGPLSDRIDLQVELRPVDPDRLVGPGDGEPTSAVAARVAAARAVAAERWGPGTLNRSVPPPAVRATCDAGAVRALASAVDQLALSARSFDRALRVARTIADLAGAETVSIDHVDEAVAYRLATRLAAT